MPDLPPLVVYALQESEGKISIEVQMVHLQYLQPQIRSTPYLVCSQIYLTSPKILIRKGRQRYNISHLGKNFGEASKDGLLVQLIPVEL
jgi:hypothetical protein